MAQATPVPSPSASPTPARLFPDEPLPLTPHEAEFRSAENPSVTVHVHTDGDRQLPKPGERITLSLKLADHPESAEQILGFTLGEPTTLPSLNQAAEKLPVGATATLRVSPVPELWLPLLPPNESGAPPDHLTVHITRLPDPLESTPSRLSNP